MLNQFFLSVFPLVTFCKLTTGLHGKMCYVYCLQCNVGTVCLFDFPDYQSLKVADLENKIKINGAI